MSERVLTVREPWASAIAWLGKRVENRVRNVAGSYRGRLWIHAGSTPPTVDELVEVSRRAGTQIRPDSMRMSHIVAAVTLHDVCRPDECRCTDSERRWAEPGLFHLRLTDVIASPQQWPVRGRLGLWRMHPDGIRPSMATRLYAGTPGLPQRLPQAPATQAVTRV